MFFFFNDTATTEIYTLSLHDALPIYADLQRVVERWSSLSDETRRAAVAIVDVKDRKSTRLNSSHLVISYAVFCLKKKKTHPAVSRHGLHSVHLDCPRATSRIHPYAHT